ncbi:hypothetical protein GALL_549960 [mine drainage metagenome]|uniref:Uncharacterized protein n=1 Tax=mine drainage metagenome TaxID=410659 RepID=A0A1J5P6P2_9ZZZZ
MLKNYLELDNVSFLFGSGSSIHLGAVAIRNFPLEVETYILEKDKIIAGIKAELITTIKGLQAETLNYGTANFIPGTNQFSDSRSWKFYIEDDMVRDFGSKEIAVEYEKVLNFLIAKDYVLSQDKSTVRTDKISELIMAIKEGLFVVCNLETKSVSQVVINKKKSSTYEKDVEQGKLLGACRT